MLLKQMLEAPTTSSKLVVYDPFKPLDRVSLLKEVVGLANARVDGPRNILFGINPSALNGNSVVGIDDDAVRDLKRAHRLISSLVEPGLHLAFIFDKINGKLVGALEIDGCDFGPYFLAEELSDELQRGSCWIREERELMPVTRHELLNGNAPEAAEPEPDTVPDEVTLSVGFYDDPECDFVEVDVPDTSDPPFEESSTNGSVRFTQTLRVKISTMTAQMLKLARQQGKPATTTDDTQDVGAKIADAVRKNFYLEERAVKLNICIRNDCGLDIKNLTFEIGFPVLPGFDVAHRIYSSPFDKRAESERSKLAYPEVALQDDGAIAKARVALLPARSTESVFGAPLRLAVGPEALGRKIALPYVLRTPDGREIANGRLKMRLGPAPTANAAPAGAEQTHYKSLDDD